MKISIITATYNSQNNISDCLQSVAAQAYPNIEHIIIDGASTDNTLEIIKSTLPKGLTNRVTQLVSEPDNGIYDALNKGIKLATGDVIGFLHSDDLLGSENTLKNIAGVFESNENIDGIYGNLLFVNTQNTNKVLRTWHSKPFHRKNVKYGWMPPHPSLFLRREVYEKHGLFDTTFKVAGDYDFMLRVMQDKEINLHFIPEVITRMRVGGVSTGSLKGIITKSKEDIRALRNNGFRFTL